jgi:hypothetical protein
MRLHESRFDRHGEHESRPVPVVGDDQHGRRADAEVFFPTHDTARTILAILYSVRMIADSHRFFGLKCRGNADCITFVQADR